jgi:hypothetical protein
MTQSCNEAVLLIGFNRPDLLARVIDAVRVVAPPRVYLAIDGPRDGRDEEAHKVAACRSLADTIDWKCEVHTLIREENLGCGRGVSGAITWFFEHEEQGIILEDDIVPVSDFFDYASTLLARYSTDPCVGAISGTNFVPPKYQTNPRACRFSRVPIVWGWATWRHVWAEYRFDIAGWRDTWNGPDIREAMGGTRPSEILWSANFDLMARHAIDTWDLQFVFTCMSRGLLTVVPPVNLVENLGFRSDATHTVRLPNYLRPAESPSQLVPYPEVVLDDKADRWLMKNVYEASYAGLARLATRYLVRKVRG